jgi:hypothetical protein
MDLAPGNVECLLEFRGKLVERGGDFGWLLAKSSHHAFGHMWFVPNEFCGSHHQGKMIVDVMTQRRQLAVHLFHLLYRKCYGLTGQTHSFTMSFGSKESKPVYYGMV